MRQYGFYAVYAAVALGIVKYGLFFAGMKAADGVLGTLVLVLGIAGLALLLINSISQLTGKAPTE